MKTIQKYQVVLPQSPQEEEALVSLLDQLEAVGCPDEILVYVDSYIHVYTYSVHFTQYPLKICIQNMTSFLQVG